MGSPGHHPLGASGAYRWMRCPGSVRLIEAVGKDESTTYAETGTVAAALADRHFRTGEPLPEAPFVAVPGSLGNTQAVTLHADDLEALEVYIRQVRDPDFTRRLFLELELEDQLELVEELSEFRVNLSHWIPGVFSTLDHAAVWKATNRYVDDDPNPRFFLVVTDLKFGSGVPVVAKDNPQLTMYEAGALEYFDLSYRFESVAGVICQPRSIGSTACARSPKGVRASMLNLAGYAALALKPHAPLVPGPEQCRFCNAKGACDAHARWVDQNVLLSDLPSVSLRPPNADSMSETTLLHILENLDTLNPWLEAVKRRAAALAGAGSLPGWKLVAGRATRKWTDEDELRDAWTGLGRDPDTLYSRSLISPAQAEKIIGKKRVTEALGALIQKPEGAPTLVRDSDPRPAHSEALASEFDAVIGSS